MFIRLSRCDHTGHSKNLNERGILKNAELLHIATKVVPVDCSNSIAFVGRYEYSLRRVFDIIKSEAPDHVGKDTLQMAVKSINDSAGSDALSLFR